MKGVACVATTWGLKVHSQGQQTIRDYWSIVILTLPIFWGGRGATVILNLIFRRVGWQKILNFALKIKKGGMEGGTWEVLRPCHPLKIWNVHLTACHICDEYIVLVTKHHTVWHAYVKQRMTLRYGQALADVLNIIYKYNKQGSFDSI